ncbi:MAG: integration host factor subunit beta [Acidobacteria bacterium]|nr:integration host factor subunit beta [Acidobacteriota bacterium]
MDRTTRNDLVRRLTGEGLPRRQAVKIVNSILSGIADGLSMGETVTLRGFGSFTTRRRPFHWRQIPPSGEIVRVPERKLVKFRPGSEMKRAADLSPDDPYFDALIAKRRKSSRQLLSQPELNPLVHDAQFDLGIAYREMGLPKEALEKFITALTLIDERERGARYVRCCYMIGLCNMDIGNFDVAHGWFQSGLAAPRRPVAERIELHYQLGLLFEKEGRVAESLAELKQVQTVNPRFREVAGHIRSLRALRVAQSVHQ